MKAGILNIVKICFVAFILAGCEKTEDFPIFKSPEGNLKLKRVLRYSSIDQAEPVLIAEEYEYNDKGLISMVSAPLAFIDSVEFKYLFYNLYEYDAQDRLVKISCCNYNIYADTGYINLRNYIYTYFPGGLLEKEYQEFPVISSFEYATYKYNKGRLSIIENYKMGTDERENQVVYSYDAMGRLIKEQTIFDVDPGYISFTDHFYSEKGLLIKSEVYAGRQAGDLTFIREVHRTYDENNNLTILESNEISLYSSQSSYVLRYEYYE